MLELMLDSFEEILAIAVAWREARGLTAATETIVLPKFEPGTMGELLIVLAIGSRDVAGAERTSVGNGENALQQLDLGNGLFRFHPLQ